MSPAWKWIGACGLAMAAAVAVAKTQTTSSAAAPAPSVTVTARPAPSATVDHQAYAFVNNVAVQPEGESLVRWNQPICPLVTGLTDEQDEAMAARIVDAARAAGAPVGDDGCQANLVVIATTEPARMLAAWEKRDPEIFGNGGPTEVNAFLARSRPVRAWYNVERTTANGETFTTDAALYGGLPSVHVPTISRLHRVTVLGISSAIVVVDTTEAIGFSVGQIADYVTMASLAKINLQADVAGAPTILRLFSAAESDRPAGLTDWDKGFLKGVYATDQASPLQRSVIAATVTRAVTQSSARR